MLLPVSLNQRVEGRKARVSILKKVPFEEADRLKRSCIPKNMKNFRNIDTKRAWMLLATYVYYIYII